MRLTTEQWLAQAKRDERARCLLSLRQLRAKIEGLDASLRPAEMEPGLPLDGGQLALFDTRPLRHGQRLDAVPA